MRFKCKNVLIMVMGTCLLPLLAAAQNPNNVPMAGLMRSNGKIYVVVAVLVLIFIGILLFLLRIERRLNRLEKEAE